MTSTDLDQATREAVAALVHRIRERDFASEEDKPDAEPFALEFVMAMRFRGWRPTPAQAAVSWPPPVGRGADPAKHADALAEARIDCANAAAKLRSDESERTP
ncbi:hypothetical protein [Nonomuraea basaltis]|uniref:hypothetical protein n=1 Tax=Nonomuraea basaltis TaxID=2495887 RepID=UPI00110C59F2|nr:hypothetical protein [Nonomuraea basaltis]TMS00134.1 hypothetical protein EJK15_03420 [Nonomuraea basaltis]